MPHGTHPDKPPQSSPQARRRSDAGRPQITHRDITGLTWAAQMYASPYDLLAARLGVTESRVRGIVLRWRRAGLADSAVLASGPAWCWVTPEGMRNLGYPWTAQPPAISRLAHIRAVQACRMWLEAGEGYRQWRASWRPERHIRAVPGVGQRGHVPDAEVTWPTIAGSPRSGEAWAIEVELTPKPLARTAAIMSGLLAGPYAHVIYLCAPPAAAVAARAASRFPAGQAARLTVRPVPPAALGRAA